MPHALMVDVVDQHQISDPLHVFDLPQLYTKPSATELLSALSLLTIEPRSWSPTSRHRNEAPAVNPEGITSYLTRIISSPLAWLSDDAEKETIWETASVRLAERSGRSAMPAMERTFRIAKREEDFELSGDGDIEILLHEPSLTADNLGLKTWCASYLLSKRLHELELPSLQKELSKTSQGLYQVLELGSGTGLVGMAAAAVLGAGVVLTDLPEIESNLARNVETNRTVIQRNGGLARTAVLDWLNPAVLLPSSPLRSLTASAPNILNHLPINPINPTNALPTPPDSSPATPSTPPPSFPVILAADCIYSPTHPALLVSTIETWLSKSADSRVVIELPLRSAYSGDVDELRRRMRQIGLALLEEGEETGLDDWGGEGDDEGREVRCWWGVWGWRTKV
ncbi:hypothetical protein NA57DRAFT_54393 [Rhizodiscina lignyota]|uniref:Uncharacterized protein n=1 Tax=Rhizodiscina lignyota TaxID=1504668 RepID=A0A9P4MAE6_9PEZI|nr:hypothetical protein NA57DRAFT_54393 [Rhizodiscina lignyota]